MAAKAKSMIFYEQPVLLNREQHRAARLGVAPDVRFAARANSFLLAAEECADAVRDYPILFIGTPDGAYTVACLTGLKTDDNLFVTAEGQWREGAYVPAFVRRYPFVLVDAADGGEMQIAVDRACPWLDLAGRYPDGERLLKDNGDNTPVMDNIAVYLLAFHKGMEQSRTFASHLASLGLLVPRSILVKNPSGSTAMEGFHAIDEDALNKLDAAATKDLATRGYLAWIHLHLASLRNVQKLAELSDRVRPTAVTKNTGQKATLQPIQTAPKPEN